MSKLKFSVLGTPRFILDEQEIQFGRRKALALMSFLVAKGQSQSRDVLCELLWSGYDKARANLRRELSLLNSLTSEKILLTNRSMVALNHEIDLEVDLQHFREAMKNAKSHLHTLDINALDIDSLERAISLYSDDFLAGFSVPDSIAFDDWQYYEAESIRRVYSNGLRVLVDWLSQQGDYARAINYMRHFLELNPYDEDAHRLLISLFAWSGEYQSAIQQYQYCENLLRSDLGISPNPQTIQLHERIIAKDFSTPKVEAKKKTNLHNIPTQTLQFFGRDKELADLIKLAQDRMSPLITVLAPGGMGKTRLVLEVAHHLLETGETQYKDGIFLVELASISKSENIVSAISHAINLVFQTDDRSPNQQLLDYLEHKEMLLILDNFEHLLDASMLVSDLLQSAAKLQIIVTSRQILQLQEETIVHVPELTIPIKDDYATALDYGASQLFLYTSKRTNPRFELHEDDLPHLIRICELVGGMPLGIILAASWVDALSLSEIVDEISRSLDILSNEVRNIPERHHNIRAVFDPTWRSLTEHERNIFMKLSVFQGGFTQQAATKVADAGIRELATLVKKSLLGRDMQTGRYNIHELLRQYATEHLISSGFADAIRDKHSAYYLNWLASLEADLTGQRQIDALYEIDTDSENVYGAWYRAIQINNFDNISKSVQAFFHFHDMRGFFHRARDCLQDAIHELDKVDITDKEYIYDRILTRHMKVMLIGFRHYDVAHLERVELHLKIAKQRGDHLEAIVIMGVMHLLTIWFHNHNKRRIMQLYEQLLHHVHIIDNDYHLSDILGSTSLSIEGDQRDVTRKAIDLQRRTGNLFGLIWSLQLLIIENIKAGEYDPAINDAKEMLALAQIFHNSGAMNIANGYLMLMNFYQGDFDASKSKLEQILIHPDQHWYVQMQSLTLVFSCLIMCIRDENYTLALEKLESHNFENYWANTPVSLVHAVAYCGLGEFILAKPHFKESLNNTISYILGSVSEFGISAILLANDGKLEKAVEYLSLTKQQFEEHVGWFWKWSLVNDLMTRLKAELGEDLFNQAWERGAKLNIADAIQDFQKDN